MKHLKYLIMHEDEDNTAVNASCPPTLHCSVCFSFTCILLPWTACVVLKHRLCLLPQWDHQGPPSPRQPLPWKPAPQRNDPFEYQCVEPLCSSASSCSGRIQAGAQKTAFAHFFGSLFFIVLSSFARLLFSFPRCPLFSTWASSIWHTNLNPTTRCTRKERDSKCRITPCLFVIYCFKFIPPLFDDSHSQHVESLAQADSMCM